MILRMRVLISGGAGFIGSHLSDNLVSRGHSVHVLDDLSTGQMANVRHLTANPLFSYTIDTAHDRRVVAELVDDADVVYHLAAAVGVELIVKSPVQTIETNVHCTEVVLAAASKKNKPVIVASTSEVYGKSTALPYCESGDIVLGSSTMGRWSYACSKALDEFLALAYWKERGLPTIVVRLFNTVGPRQTGQYGMVVPNFVRSALAGEDLRVHGDGKQSRCFCHVGDVTEGLVQLLGNEQHYGEIFNIGSTEEISIEDLALRVTTLADSSSGMVKIPYAEAYEAGFEDMVRRIPDTSKIQSAIGWRATRTLDEILLDVIAHERDVGSTHGRAGELV